MACIAPTLTPYGAAMIALAVRAALSKYHPPAAESDRLISEVVSNIDAIVRGCAAVVVVVAQRGEVMS